MKIPESVRGEYATPDPETDLVLEVFDEPEGAKVLEVGSHDAPIASMLSDCGFRVFGVDLRPCDQKLNYAHFQGDFCKMINFHRQNSGSFDVAISVSALEHFGLNTYGEGMYRAHYDVLAARYIYDLLKPGGKFYVTVPFAGKFREVGSHWRVYDWGSFLERIVQDFVVTHLQFRVCEAFSSDGIDFKAGDPISVLQAQCNLVGNPFVSVFAVLQKRSS